MLPQQELENHLLEQQQQETQFFDLTSSLIMHHAAGARSCGASACSIRLYIEPNVSWLSRVEAGRAVFAAALYRVDWTVRRCFYVHCRRPGPLGFLPLRPGKSVNRVLRNAPWLAVASHPAPSFSLLLSFFFFPPALGRPTVKLTWLQHQPTNLNSCSSDHRRVHCRRGRRRSTTTTTQTHSVELAQVHWDLALECPRRPGNLFTACFTGTSADLYRRAHVTGFRSAPKFPSNQTTSPSCFTKKRVHTALLLPFPLEGHPALHRMDPGPHRRTTEPLQEEDAEPTPPFDSDVSTPSFSPAVAVPDHSARSIRPFSHDRTAPPLPALAPDHQQQSRRSTTTTTTGSSNTTTGDTPSSTESRFGHEHALYQTMPLALSLSPVIASHEPTEPPVAGPSSAVEKEKGRLAPPEHSKEQTVGPLR